MSHADLPLFSWIPPRRVIVFPMKNRVGRVKNVAARMLAKTTERHAEFYREQVTSALVASLKRLGIADAEHGEHLIAFWSAVDAEMVRLRYCSDGHGKGDAA